METFQHQPHTEALANHRIWSAVFSGSSSVYAVTAVGTFVTNCRYKPQ